jgi:hypothetical protein
MWKTIQDFEYEISIDGDVRNKNTGRILKSSVDRYGYLKIGLRKKDQRQKYWFTIHRLIGMYFIDNPNGYSQIDHIDRNKLNNAVDNLRWVDSVTNNLNRKDSCWTTNKIKELYISKYKNGYMIRINRSDYKFRSWSKSLENAVSIRNKCMEEIRSRSM